jgi:MFS family permease
MHSHPQPLNKDNQKVWRTRNVWAFSLASLFSDWGHEMVTSLMPGFLIAIGAPVIALGVTEGVSNFAQALAAIWGGRVSDQKTHRHSLLIFGYILTGVKALMAWVSWWPWVVVLRTVAWTGRGARGPIRDAYIAEEVPAEHVGKAYGLREAFDTAGAVLGPLCAALLVAHVSPRTLIAWTAVPAFITILVILRVRKLPVPAVEAARPDQFVKVTWPRSFVQYRTATWIFTTGYLAPTFFILLVWQSHATLGPLSSETLALLLYTLHYFVYAAS